MRRPVTLLWAAVMAAVAVAAAVVAVRLTTGGPEPIRVGAVYPLSGSQGPGGTDEYRGVRLAADLANEQGGVGGHPIELEPVDVSGPDAAPSAIATLSSRGVRFVLGTYGSTISGPAATEAARRGMLFWETGAVGSMGGPAGGRSFFRVAPSGSVLGSSAVAFVADRLAPLLHRPADSLRFAVANVDDVYGSAVARGAVEEVRSRGLPFAGQFAYGLQGFDPAAQVRRIAASHPDVLFVSAYMEDGVALRRAMVNGGLHLAVNIGTSSSYCMPGFGAALGRDAVGLFASDKPDAGSIDPAGLAPAGRALLARAAAAYLSKYHQDMSAAALAGFSAAWALFRDVMPQAAEMNPGSVAAAALRVRIPTGTLPNGSGLAFAPPGSADAGANLRAASVIWEWIGVRRRAVVWPPPFATTGVRAIPIAP
jgi:branched-chain amino acid transport system substrate-binding protein